MIMGLIPHPRPPRPNDPVDLERYSLELKSHARHYNFYGLGVVVSVAMFCVLIFILSVSGCY